MVHARSFESKLNSILIVKACIEWQEHTILSMSGITTKHTCKPRKSGVYITNIKTSNS